MENRLEIDISSVVTGAGFVAITGWLASFLALRKHERSVHIEQITKERSKWRSDIRALTQDIVKEYSKADSPPSVDFIQESRARLVTSLNPNCQDDEAILEEYDALAHGGDMSRFTKAIALLLKHDWERVKWECMPIYLKPINCFREKHSAWKKDGFRTLTSEG